MSDIGLTVSGMTKPPNRYHVTVTVARDSGYLPGPAEFAVAADLAASSRNAVSVVSAHTAEQIISVVTVEMADRSAAVAVALAVVSEALRRPAALPSR
jgi:hypothetical protein